MNKINYRREIKVEDGYDLVVAGGGTAGTAAAVSAARLGARVLLVEALGCLGGTGTSGLVLVLEPLSNGPTMLCGGIVKEAADTLIEKGWAANIKTLEEWNASGCAGGICFDSEGLKLVLDDMVSKAGVETRFFTTVADADTDAASKTVKGVIISNIEGLSYIKAKTFIDATGDAVLSDFCGADYYEAGRDTPNIMPPTLCAVVGGINWKDLTILHGGPRGQQEKVEQAISDGFFSQSDRHVPGLFFNKEPLGCMNAGHIFGMNSCNCRSLSDGMKKGRRLVQEYADFYRKYFGFNKFQVITTAAMMGIRESRRVKGEYTLNYDDYKARRQFPDQIGIFSKSVDIHVYDCTPEEYARYHEEYTKTDRYSPGECYGIPYGILVPKGWKNLWVAGRCASTDIKVHGSLRVQPAAYMMGEAAGAAAVQAINTGKSAGEIDTGSLVKTLREQVAILPQKTLGNDLTKN